MRYFAREFDPENEEFWGIVGLLHDLDWEEYEDDPMNHTIYAAEILEGEGATPELIRAIQTHSLIRPLFLNFLCFRIQKHFLNMEQLLRCTILIKADKILSGIIYSDFLSICPRFFF